MHNFTLKITSARALIKARLNKGQAVSKVEKNKGLGYKTSKYGIFQRELNLNLAEQILKYLDQNTGQVSQVI